MKKPKHWSQPATRIHQSKDDRTRAWSGKTTSRKVRCHGRYLATLEKSAETKQSHQAATAKHHPPQHH